MPSALRRMHAFVDGYVQGVGFRYFVIRQASRLGLTGFVRNLPDGRVEVVAEGPEDGLRQLLLELHRGPSGASVSSVASTFAPATGEFHTFGVRY
jgi:acylphosphatase